MQKTFQIFSKHQAQKCLVIMEKVTKMNTENLFQTHLMLFLKLKVHNKIQNLRKEYDWNFVSGIMFNHDRIKR